MGWGSIRRQFKRSTRQIGRQVRRTERAIEKNPEAALLAAATFGGNLALSGAAPAGGASGAEALQPDVPSAPGETDLGDTIFEGGPGLTGLSEEGFSIEFGAESEEERRKRRRAGKSKFKRKAKATNGKTKKTGTSVKTPQKATGLSISGGATGVKV